MTSGWDGATTVPQMLALRAAETPQAAAFHLEASGGHWAATTWQEFGARVATFGRGLRAAGLRSGDRLALIAPVSLEWELLHHAALGVGIVVVALDAHDLPARIAAMVELADVVGFATTDPRSVSEVNAERLGRAPLLLHVGSDDTDLAARLPGRRVLTLDGLQRLGDDEPADAKPGQAPTAQAVATIIFTSGTTGAPKGIAYTHGQVALAIHAICDAFPFANADSRLLCWLPLSNLFQRVVNLAGLRKGAATYLLADPRRVMDVVAAVSPDVFVGVPRFFEKLYDGLRTNIAAQPALQRRMVSWAWGVGRRRSQLQLDGLPVPTWLAVAHAAADRAVLSRLRVVMGTRLQCLVTGSAPAPQHLLEEFHALGWLVLEAYGLSENVLPMAMNRIDAYRFGTVGRALAGNEISIGATGEIRVKGPGVFSGYLGPADSAAIDAEGFYATGDLGAWDRDGYLRLTGRSGDLIKTSTGRRVAPAGVEAQLRAVSGIDHAVLIGAGRKCLVVLCTVTHAAQLEAPARELLDEALRVQVAGLNAHERPLAIALLRQSFSIEAGELTPNLKLKRSAIAARHALLIERLYAALDHGSGAPAQHLLVIAD